jgi:dipeptide/tripeptide permease
MEKEERSMKLIINIISGVAFFFLYAKALEKLIIYFKDQIDHELGWCCLSIAILSGIYHALEDARIEIFNEWSKK